MCARQKPEDRLSIFHIKRDATSKQSTATMRVRSFTICGSMWWFGVSASALRYRLVTLGL